MSLEKNLFSLLDSMGNYSDTRITLSPNKSQLLFPKSNDRDYLGMKFPKALV